MTDEGWPDQVGLHGQNFHIIAVRLGKDATGKMRYAMRFEDGTPVRVNKVEYRKSRCGLTFMTELGLMTFEFSTEEGI